MQYTQNKGTTLAIFSESLEPPPLQDFERNFCNPLALDFQPVCIYVRNELQLFNYCLQQTQKQND